MGEDGIEIATQPLLINNYLPNKLNNVCKKITDGGYTANSKTCGLHIHFNSNTLENKDLRKIWKIYYQFQNYLFSMIPNSRRNNRYCAKLKKPPASCTFLDSSWYGGYSSMSYRKNDKYDSSRYKFVNLHSHYYRGTVEIRNHPGTLNVDKVMNWIFINKNLMNFAINHNYIKKINKERFLNIASGGNELIKNYIKRRTDLFSVFDCNDSNLTIGEVY